jgi:Flp pilus assembly protein TadG
MLKTAIVGAVVKRVARFSRDRHGVVLQETALVLPVLVTLILAGYDIARFALLQQKLSRMVMTTADMVSQGATISIPEIDTIFNASSTMVQPFSAGSLQIMFVSSVSRTGTAAPKVDWQRSGGGTMTGQTSKLGIAGSNATLPTDFLIRSGEDAIIAEVYYRFTPVFMPEMILPTTLYHRAIFRPRQSSLTTLCTTLC